MPVCSSYKALKIGTWLTHIAQKCGSQGRRSHLEKELRDAFFVGLMVARQVLVQR
jgi:hypothetical protein